MANLLDEVTGPVNTAGRDVNVIDKQIPVTVGIGSTIFEICLWVVPIVVAILIPLLAGESWFIAAAGIVPGLIWLYIKQKAHKYLQQLEQKMQAAASQIDNYLEQRRQIILNLMPQLQVAINLDKDVMKSVAALRSGIPQGEDLNSRSAQINKVAAHLCPQLEAYPELRSHEQIAYAMQQNDYLQREITAARTVYNNVIAQWNRDIFDWPAKQIVAAKQKYSTSIPYSISAEKKQEAQSALFANLK